MYNHTYIHSVCTTVPINIYNYACTQGVKRCAPNLYVLFGVGASIIYSLGARVCLCALKVSVSTTNPVPYAFGKLRIRDKKKEKKDKKKKNDNLHIVYGYNFVWSPEKHLPLIYFCTPRVLSRQSAGSPQHPSSCCVYAVDIRLE